MRCLVKYKVMKCISTYETCAQTIKSILISDFNFHPCHLPPLSLDNTEHRLEAHQRHLSFIVVKNTNPPSAGRRYRELEIISDQRNSMK